MSKIGKRVDNMIKRAPMEPHHGSVIFDVEFGNPFDPRDNTLVLSNSVELQLNLTADQLETCLMRLTFLLETVRDAMKTPSPVTSSTKTAMSFIVSFGEWKHGTLQEHSKDLRQNLTDSQLKECEDALLFHIETIKLAKTLSNRNTVVLDLSDGRPGD